MHPPPSLAWLPHPGRRQRSRRRPEHRLQEFGVPRVGLHHEARLAPPDHPVEAPHLLDVAWIAAQLPHHLQKNALRELLAHPLEVLVQTAEHEVVAVHKPHHAPLWVIEAHRASAALLEAQGLQRRSGKALPLLGRIAGPVETPLKPAAVAGLGPLRRQLDTDVPHCRGV